MLPSRIGVGVAGIAVTAAATLGAASAAATPAVPEPSPPIESVYLDEIGHPRPTPFLDYTDAQLLNMGWRLCHGESVPSVSTSSGLDKVYVVQLVMVAQQTICPGGPWIPAS